MPSFESGLFVASNSFPPGHADHDPEPGHREDRDRHGHRAHRRPVRHPGPPVPEDGGGARPPPGNARQGAGHRSAEAAIRPRRRQPGDQTVSSDPDVNPAAAYGGTDTAPAAAVPAAVAAAVPTAAPSTETPADRRRRPATETPSTPTEETLPATAAATTPAETTPTATPEAPVQEQPQTPPQTTTASTTPTSPDADNAAIISAARVTKPPEAGLPAAARGREVRLSSCRRRRRRQRQPRRQPRDPQRSLQSRAGRE